MIITIEAAVWKCTICDGMWVGRKGDERPERCPKRKCRAVANAVAATDWDRRKGKPAEEETHPPSGDSPLGEAREVEPSWVRNQALPRTVTNRKCHCGWKIELVWVEEDNQRYPVCTGPGRHWTGNGGN